MYIIVQGRPLWAFYVAVQQIYIQTSFINRYDNRQINALLRALNGALAGSEPDMSLYDLEVRRIKGVGRVF